MQSETYINGKLFSTVTFDYDSQGNTVESAGYKADGTLEPRARSRFDARGNVIESVSDGPGDNYCDVIEPHNQHTGEPESFTRLDRDGSVWLSFTTNGRTVLSYHGGGLQVCARRVRQLDKPHRAGLDAGVGRAAGA